MLINILIPSSMGQNPTSGVLSVERRKEIYSLCCKYDVLIIEDDPYWYLQYPSANPMNIKLKRPTAFNTSNYTSSKPCGFPFLDSLQPSYLSVDTEGRVLRLDTFSKTIAPGCRLGYITAQPALIERILRITETSTQQPSGFVQAMIAELLIGPQTPSDTGRGGSADGSGWDMSGWVRWLEGLRGNYERRMNSMANILHAGQHLVKAGRRRSLAAIDSDDEEWAVVEKTKMYDFAWPMGGMFLWLKFDFATHPLGRKLSGAKLSRALWILWTQKPYLVLVTPGQVFAPTGEIRDAEGWAYFRMCFAACDENVLEPITNRFVEGIHAFWRIKDVKQIEELLEEDNATLVPEIAALCGPC
jgi:DNA-binding transcriptional MocR family regulator